MPFNRHFVMYNEPFMYVEPVEALIQRSNHAKAVVERGDIFAVNMNSGALTVITKKKLSAAGYVFTAEHGFFTKNAKQPSAIEIYVNQKYGTNNRMELPLNVEKALKILEQIYRSNVIYDLLKDRMLYVFSNREVTPVSFTANDNWFDYEHKVRNFFTKHAIKQF